MIFINALMVMMLAVLLIGGFFYWVWFLIKKWKPDFRFWFKYKILRRKHKQEDVEMLMEVLNDDVSDDNLIKYLLISGKAKPRKVAELLYIYQELKKLKGGESK